MLLLLSSLLLLSLLLLLLLLFLKVLCTFIQLLLFSHFFTLLLRWKETKTIAEYDKMIRLRGLKFHRGRARALVLKNFVSLPLSLCYLSLNTHHALFLSFLLYGQVIWGGCPNTDLLQSLEILHRRAARIIYNLPRDMPTDEVYRHSNWNTLTFNYKLRLLKWFHSVIIGEVSAALSYLISKPCTANNFRRSNNIIVPRFNLQFLKSSISYRGAILWNAVSSHFTGQFTDFYRKVKKEFYFKELDFSTQLVQSLPRHYPNFKCF